MKTLSLTLSLGLGILLAGQLPAVGPITAGNTVMIVQTSSDNPPNVSYIYKNYDKGEAEILFPVSEGGDTFDLYVLGDIWDQASNKWIEKLYMVDSKVVKAYSPEGSIEVISGDAEWSLGTPGGNYVKRTRADKPYTLNVKVAGLLTADPNAPLSAKSVRLDRSGLNYTPGSSTNNLDPAYNSTGPNNVVWTQETYSMTGDKKDWVIHDQLTPLGSTQVCGEERWQLTRLADTNPLLSETVIQSVTVQVWPMATAEFSGISEGEVILDSVPQLVVKLNELYPDSYTYCKIYADGDTVGKVIPLSEQFIGKHYNDKYNTDGDGLNNYPSPQVQPQSLITFLINLNVNAPTDGKYTIKVFTETPFNNYAQIDELAKINFTVNRKTAMRGTLSSGN